MGFILATDFNIFNFIHLVELVAEAIYLFVLVLTLVILLKHEFLIKDHRNKNSFPTQ